MSQESLVSLASSYSSEGQGARRPHTLHISQSFSRFEPAESRSLCQARASTVQTGNLPSIIGSERTTTSPDAERADSNTDIFEVSEMSKESESKAAKSVLDLPIELMSLTDRFVESLSAKIHPTPPSVQRLSDLFQEFYVKAEGNIATHISTISSQQYRRRSQNPSVLSRKSSKTPVEVKARSVGSKETQKYTNGVGLEQQMLTPAEIAERRRARILLDQERTLLEEAVERRACELVYDRIWRHRSTQDEERDEKLRSRTAALAVVGIGLKELGIDLSSTSDKVCDESQIKDWLDGARQGLIKMNDSKHPMGKLFHLTAAHKAIVDTLSRLFPSSKSADEILPTLIYALITTPPEGINIISNLYFIQRFRAAKKMNGEAAYVLTNLEAAVTFLETVDLASLKAGEVPEGPPKTQSHPSTPKSTIGHEMMQYFPTCPPPAATTEPAMSPDVDASTPPKAHRQSTSTSPPVTPNAPLHHRRISNLLQPPTSAIGAASDAVKSSADQGLKNISTTLENSYKFLFGRLKEQHAGSSTLDGTDGVVPKTLDDARRLVGTPSPPGEDGAGSGANSSELGDAESLEGRNAPQDDRLLSLIGGRSKAREKSVDSSTSNESDNRTNPNDVIDQNLKGKPAPLFGNRVMPNSPHPAGAQTSSANPAMESMRNLGTTLNPLNRLAGLNVMRGFNKGNPTTPPPSNSPAPDKPREPPPVQAPTATSRSPTSRSCSMKSTNTILPPIKKFIDLDDASDLRIGEVAELLTDYRRLAGALKDLGAI